MDAKQFRDAGFTDNEIKDYLVNSGFSENEVSSYLNVDAPKANPISLKTTMDKTNLMGALSQNISPSEPKDYPDILSPKNPDIVNEITQTGARKYGNITGIPVNIMDTQKKVAPSDMEKAYLANESVIKDKSDDVIRNNIFTDAYKYWSGTPKKQIINDTIELAKNIPDNTITEWAATPNQPANIGTKEWFKNLGKDVPKSLINFVKGNAYELPKDYFVAIEPYSKIIKGISKGTVTYDENMTPIDKTTGKPFYNTRGELITDPYLGIQTETMSYLKKIGKDMIQSNMPFIRTIMATTPWAEMNEEDIAAWKTAPFSVLLAPILTAAALGKPVAKTIKDTASIYSKIASTEKPAPSLQSNMRYQPTLKESLAEQVSSQTPEGTFTSIGRPLAVPTGLTPTGSGTTVPTGTTPIVPMQTQSAIKTKLNESVPQTVVAPPQPEVKPEVSTQAPEGNIAPTVTTGANRAIDTEGKTPVTFVAEEYDPVLKRSMVWVDKTLEDGSKSTGLFNEKTQYFEDTTGKPITLEEAKVPQTPPENKTLESSNVKEPPETVTQDGSWVKDIKETSSAWDNPRMLKLHLDDMIHDLKLSRPTDKWKTELENDVKIVTNRLNELTQSEKIPNPKDVAYTSKPIDNNIVDTESLLNNQKGSISLDMINPAKWTKVRRYIEDNWIDVKNLIRREGTKVTDANNPYDAEIRMWGRIGARSEEANGFAERVDSNILKTAKDFNVNDAQLIKDINDYNIARHAPDYNKQHGEKAAGITNDEAYAKISELESKPYYNDMVKIADEIQTFSNKTLDTLYEGGVISKELYDNLREKYKKHVPLNRILPDEDIAQYITNEGLSVRGTGLKRAKGSELEVNDILGNVMYNYKAALARAEKNIVDNYTLRFIRDNEFFDGLFEEYKPKAIGETFPNKEGKRNVILEKVDDPQVLSLMENGKQVHIKINDKQLAMALKGINKEHLSSLMRFVSAFTRLYSGLMTRFNPEFAIPNKIRDLQEVAAYMASKGDISKKGVLNIFKDDHKSMMDIVDYLRGKDTDGAKLYQQMREDGGTTGGLGLSTKKDIEIDIDKIRAINRSKPRKAAQMAVRLIDHWNTIFEDSTRLTVYREALKDGLSRERAAVYAKEASINFNKRGTGTPITNAFYMFSNASVQGSAKMIRALKNPKVMLGVMTILGSATYAVAEWNDKIDPDWRNKVSKWDKLNGINVVLPSEKEGISYITLPISWGLKPLNVALQQMESLTSGHNVNINDAVQSIFAAAIDSYNPMGGTDARQSISPTIFDVLNETGTNKSWTGSKIKPDYSPDAPESIKYFDNLNKKLTGRALISATRKLSDVSGGRIELSPASLNYILESYIGGTGRFASKALNTIFNPSGKRSSQEIPFASRFYRFTPQENIADSSQDYKDLKKVLQSQSKDRFYFTQKAEVETEKLNKMSQEEAYNEFESIRKADPLLAKKIIEIKKEQDRNYTYTERLINRLGVSNGQRAEYIYNKTKTMTSDEAYQYTEGLKEKGIITDKVMMQLTDLVRKGE